jgi:hypothetical protein
MMPARGLWIGGGLAVLLVMSCQSSRGPAGDAGAVSDRATRASTDAVTALRVVAVVDAIERNGYQDFMTDGSVISWTLVTFTVTGPESAWGTNVRAYCAGHPVVEEGPLLVGQLVTFDMPRPVERNALPLEQLEQLRRSR